MTQTIRQHRLGSNGPLVSAIGFGAAVLSPGYYEPVDDDTAIDTLRHALDCGVNLIDTSDVYGLGHNEELIGRAIAGRREQVVLASKFGWVVDGSSGTEIRTNYDLPGIRANGRPEYVRARIDPSLRRLQTDHLDVYYQHFPDPSTPVEETVGAMADLVRQGKVRHLGLCNVGADLLRRAHAVHPIAVVENEYSLWARTPEDAVLPTAGALGIGFVAWAPLGAGFLAGEIRDVDAGDFRSWQPRFKSENLRDNEKRFAPVREFAKTLGLTPAQLALAWLLHQNVVPIPGMTQRWQVDENCTAAQVTLDRSTLDRIDALAPRGLAAGAELV